MSSERTAQDYSNAELFHVLWREARLAPTYDKTVWLELEKRLTEQARRQPAYARMVGT